MFTVLEMLLTVKNPPDTVAIVYVPLKIALLVQFMIVIKLPTVGGTTVCPAKLYPYVATWVLATRAVLVILYEPPLTADTIVHVPFHPEGVAPVIVMEEPADKLGIDRKSTRLNSSHVRIS